MHLALGTHFWAKKSDISKGEQRYQIYQKLASLKKISS